MIGHFDLLWNECSPAFKQVRVHQYAKGLALSGLVALARKTVTGLLRASGQQFVDWSAAYRFFSESRVDPQAMFDCVREGVLKCFPDDTPIVAAMDDTILRKTGIRIPGVAYRRDPLSPPFNLNLVRGQRFIQISATVPAASEEAPSRAIPIDLTHAPTVKKPKKTAPAEQWRNYKKAVRKHNLSVQGVNRLKELRKKLDADQTHRDRRLWITVDGSYTNKNVLSQLPERTTLIGRIRQDAKLYYLPTSDSQTGSGRKRVYGDRAPTPEELRKDSQTPWQTVPIFAAGKMHMLKYKTIAPLRWRKAGKKHLLRLIVIAPLAYRPRKGSRLLYRKPAYLIVTEPDADIQKIIQAYVGRWDIEVNFRDEKTILGVGQAQVRSAQSVETVPAFLVASYAMLLLAAVNAFGVNGSPDMLPAPKWYRKGKRQRPSTQDLINQLRGELWGRGLDYFDSFATQKEVNTKPEKYYPELKSAVLYATG